MRLLNTLTAISIAFASIAQTDTIAYVNTLKINPGISRTELAERAAHIVPTPEQCTALEDGFIAFIHFGPNTFSRREWGTGMEDPRLFNPKTLDTDQWVRSMKDAGMTKVILTAKHHDGFVLWNSRYTTHGIMSSPFQNGQGDVMRELSRSCKKYGLKLGVYLSPADLYQIESPDGLYGNLSKKTKRTIPRQTEGRSLKSDIKFEFDGIDDYNEYFLNQLYELLTEYGPIAEVWFDGAHPKRKGGQTYNYTAWKKLIRTLAPEAVIFGREDIRWCGNEGGHTRETEWNIVGYNFDPDTANVFHDMTDTDLGSIDALQKATYLHYQPAEIDTSIREGWFYRDDEDQKSRSADDVFDIYERAIGGNAIFLLNIPPNREGRFSQTDVEVLSETGRRIRETYGNNLIGNADITSVLLDGDINTCIDASKPIEIKLPAAVTINRFKIQEPVAKYSERIEKVALDAWIDGTWKEISSASSVGFKRIMRFSDVTSDRFRLRVEESRLKPYIADVSAHFHVARPSRLSATRSLDGIVSIGKATDGFRWNRKDTDGQLPAGTEIHYTVDGSTPTIESPLYNKPFALEYGTIKAMATLNGQTGPILENLFGYVKSEWKILDKAGESNKHNAYSAIDADPTTYWECESCKNASITIDLGKNINISGIIYTPQISDNESMISRGIIETSADGKTWHNAGTWEFGNLINDPTPRDYRLAKPIQARYLKITTAETTSGTPISKIAEIDVY